MNMAALTKKDGEQAGKERECLGRKGLDPRKIGVEEYEGAKGRPA